jgi:DNA-binding response OmpR family regulator
VTLANSLTRILVTANRLRLAALLEKGFRLQGWTTCVATTYSAVIDMMQGGAADLVVIDADFFQADTVPLLMAIHQRRLPVVLLAGDYQVSGHDLRQIVTADDIFIKPFSVQSLMTFLQHKLAQP